MIRRSTGDDFDVIRSIVNDASQAYKVIIPSDCWKEQYMSGEEILQEIRGSCILALRSSRRPFQRESTNSANRSRVLAVMGVQHVQDVALVRHAYVKPLEQNRGIGGKLLEHIKGQVTKPLLVGTWKDAYGTVKFYEKRGFSLVLPPEKKDELLKKYWSVSERQIEESVVLADRKWFLTVQG